MVLMIDPGAARRRAEQGRAGARVESWQEGSGNAALAGRELAPAEVIAAEARLTEIARALQAAGAAGGLDQLRAAAYTALLTGRDPGTLIPAQPPPASADAPSPGQAPGQAPGSGPGDPAAGPGGGPRAWPASSAGDGGSDRAGDCGPASGARAWPASSAGDGGNSRAGGGCPGSLAALTGSVHLTIVKFFSCTGLLCDSG